MDFPFTFFLGGAGWLCIEKQRGIGQGKHWAKVRFAAVSGSASTTPRRSQTRPTTAALKPAPPPRAGLAPPAARRRAPRRRPTPERNKRLPRGRRAAAARYG